MKKIFGLFSLLLMISTSSMAYSSSHVTYHSSVRSSPSRTSGGGGSSLFKSTTKTNSYNNSGGNSNKYSYNNSPKPTYVVKPSSNTSTTNATSNNSSSFVSRVERDVENFIGEKPKQVTPPPTFANTSKPNSGVVAKTSVSNTPVATSNLSTKKTYTNLALTSAATAAVVSSSGEKSNFAATTKSNVNNDNSATIKPSVNSPPVVSLTTNKTYENLGNSTPQQPNQVLVEPSNQQNTGSVGYVRQIPSPSTNTYNTTNNYNNDNNGGYNNSNSLTNSVVNYLVLDHLINGNKKEVIVNNYTNNVNESQVLPTKQVIVSENKSNLSKDVQDNNDSGDFIKLFFVLILLGLGLFFMFKIINN